MNEIDLNGKKICLVAGGGGFIGHHLISYLKASGHHVIGVDLKHPRFVDSEADSFHIMDLRDPSSFQELLNGDLAIDEIYQLAADMGGAGYVFTGDSDADIMHNSSLINLNLLEAARDRLSKGLSSPKIFYSSSACMYPEYNQLDPQNPKTEESSAYPAQPDSEYGWEKLFSERLYLAFSRNYGIDVRIARFHNIYGPLGSYDDGREKAPAAICRKIAKLPNMGGEIEVWGDGKQTRSFLFIDDCLEAVKRLMETDFQEPVNIGSEEMISINELVELVGKVANKEVTISHKLDAPTGVRGRNSDNKLITAVLGWEYHVSLSEGINRTYQWINAEVKKKGKEQNTVTKNY